MPNLRPYQQTFVAGIHLAWSRVQSVLGIMPTGGGKTVCFSEILSRHIGASAVTVHRYEIVKQISTALASFGLKHRIVAPSDAVRRIRRSHLRIFGASFVDQQALCGVISVQTLTSRRSDTDLQLRAWLTQVTLAVFDEGHHYVNTGKWAKGVGVFPRAKLLFTTATAKRADGKGLGSHASGFVDEMVVGPSTKWLIDHKYLSPYKYFALRSDLDLVGLPLSASGDFNLKALQSRFAKSCLVKDAPKHYMRHAPGCTGLVFNTDVASATDCAESFTSQGISCVVLHGGTDPDTREKALDKLAAHDIKLVANVDLFDEGFDAPNITVCILLRATASLAKFLQMVGRVLRRAEGKDYAIIIDPVGNWERHMTPDWPRVHSLDDGPAAKDTADLTACISCSQPYEAFYRACPYCGEIRVRAKRAELRKPEQVDGDLQELDLDALATLSGARAEANMPDSDYRAEMVRRGIPEIGRPAELRRHRARKYRRKVLRTLMAWWAEAQPSDRDKGEKYRRFFLRFGVDVSTAFTLSEADTDSLINQVTRGFQHDITTNT